MTTPLGVRLPAALSRFDRYRWVWLTWLATRAIAVATITLTPRLLDDVDLFRSWLPTFHAGTFPASDPKWQYPPGVGPLLLAPTTVHLDYAAVFAAMCLVADALILGMLTMAHRRRANTPWSGLWMWAFAAFIVGPIMFTRFDIVPTVLAVAFVLLVRRPILAGGAAALGFVLKLWPALLLLALPRPATRRGIVGFCIVGAASVALIALRFDHSLSFLGNQRARGLQVESVGALPYELHALAHGHVAYGLRYGSVQVLMSGADTVGTVVSLVGVALLVLVGWWRLRGRLEAVAPGDVALTVLLISVATSRVYSPQFNIWIIGVCAVALLSTRTRMRSVALILVGTSVITQVVYPWAPDSLIMGTAFVVGIQCLRIVGLVTATVLAIRAITRAPAPDVSLPAPTRASAMLSR